MKTHSLRKAGASAIARAIAIASLIPLGACASFEGAPQPVLTTASVVQAAQVDSVRNAIENFYSPDETKRSGLSPRDYRDMIVGTHMAAADVRYADFRRELARQAKGSMFGLDLAILGLAGGASLAGKETANALAAGAAGLTGARGALNRDLYFEKTLSALLAGMDANRTRVRRNIVVRLQETAASYSLPVAYADLAEYEAAASLERAIEDATAAAVARSNDEKQLYDDQVLQFTRPAETGVAAARRPVRDLLRELEESNDVAALNRAAQAIGVTPQATAGETARAIARRVRAALTTAETEDLVTKINSAVGGGQ
jgi:hypothetical protein